MTLNFLSFCKGSPKGLQSVGGAFILYLETSGLCPLHRKDVFVMKKLALILALCLSFCLLAACGGGGPETAMSDKELDKKAESYQLNYSDEDIQSAIAVAQQYYADLAAQPIDPNVYMEHEIEEMTLWMGWLAQGVEITYDREQAALYIENRAMEDYVTSAAPGTVMFLQVAVPAAEEGHEWSHRVAEMYRETTDSPWTVRTEGI